MALARQDFPTWVMDKLAQRGRVIIHSQGSSMHPAIPSGAEVEVRPVAFDELAEGDIVVYHHRGEVFCHRLLRKRGKQCILKGDTLLAADPPVEWAHIIGRVSAVIVRGERIMPLDEPEARRRSRWRARTSYMFALLYRVRAALRRQQTRDLR